MYQIGDQPIFFKIGLSNSDETQLAKVVLYQQGKIDSESFLKNGFDTKS